MLATAIPDTSMIVSTGTMVGFASGEPHPERAAVMGEVHARPFHALETPARLLHFALSTTDAEALAGRDAVAEFCRAHALPELADGAKHHLVRLNDGTLRWEQHGEFTTYTFGRKVGGGRPFDPEAQNLVSAFARLPRPGRLLVATDLHVMGAGLEVPLEGVFDVSSLAAASVHGGRAMVATDFRLRGDYVRYLVLDRGLDAALAGALAVRLLEIETYRVLALLGLPVAQRLSPAVAEAEAELAEISLAMAQAVGLEYDHLLVDRLTALAARAEAQAAGAAFRFGASRAYDSIVQQRLVAIGEEAVDARPSLSAFLSRRLSPAMRTCSTLQERQRELSRKMSRTANLLRTRVDVEIERQNRDLLRSMNNRTRLQLRLQHTVEGLSIAAISYYVVGLGAYVFKAAHETRLLPVDPVIATAAFVPVAILAIALVLRRIRREHRD